MSRPLNVALIGHKFMGKAHSHALHDVGMFFDLERPPGRTMLCGLGDDVAATAERYGWQRWSNDWRTTVQDPEVDAVAIATPGNTHCEIAVSAAAAGKHVLCEKPLAISADEASTMLRAAERAGVCHAVNFNYRRLPAVALAQQMIAAGELGEVYYFRGTYWQDWPLDPAFPWVWRMDRDIAGAGSMADKGSHLVDLARFLAGDIREVSATSEIFVRERPADGVSRPVTTDDAAAFITRFANGAIGLFGTSRMSAGHKNSLGFEVNGSRGSIVFDLERLNELSVYTAGSGGFRTLMVTENDHPYIKSWWPPGHVIGWEHTFVHQYYEFCRAIAEKKPMSPSFEDGLRVQQVLDGVETAAREKCWVSIPQ